MKKSCLLLPVIIALTCPKAASEEPAADAKNAPHPMEVEFKKMDKDQNGSMSYEEFAANPRPNVKPEQLQSKFKSIDTDSNGSLSIQEFALSRISAPDADLAKMDTDKNGTVSADEFKQTPSAKANPEAAAKQFTKFDADSNGQLDLQELTKLHDTRVEAIKKRFP
jgi:Ca2+-binding EF-hand superfamily protein